MAKLSIQTFVDNLQLHHLSDSTLRASYVDWKDWDREFFITQLHALYPQNSNAIDKTFLQAIKDWRLLYDCMDETIVKKSFDSLFEIHNRYTVLEEADEVKAVKLLHDKLHTPNKTNWTIRFLKAQSEVSVTLPLQSIVDFGFVLMLTFRNLYKDVKEFQLNLHLQLVGTANSKALDRLKKLRNWKHRLCVRLRARVPARCAVASTTTRTNVLKWRASTLTRHSVRMLALLLTLYW